MSTPSPLNYAPRPPTNYRRVVRQIMMNVFLLAFVSLSVWCALAAWNRIRVLYWQGRCLTYSPPIGQIAIQAANASSRSPSPMVHFHPEPWLKFYNLYSPPGAASDGTVFLHEMRKPNGDTRLVAVDVLIGKTTIDPLCTRQPAYSNPPRCSIRQRRQTRITTSRLFSSLCAGMATVRFISVLSIHQNPLTLRFAIVDNQPVFYDGWLQNDESVIYSERKSRADEK